MTKAEQARRFERAAIEAGTDETGETFERVRKDCAAEATISWKGSYA